MTRWALLALLVGCESGKVTIDGDVGDGTGGSEVNDDTGDGSDSGLPAPVDADDDGYDAEVDCNDTDASIHPDADELCDGIDQDCDGAIDEDAVDQPTWYLDADGDGFGSPDTPIVACDAPFGAVDNGADCDDSEDDVNPDAVEVCGDGIDNDCDGLPGDCIITGILSVSDGAATVRGSRPDDNVGRVAGAAGDVNGDGFDDLIVGIPDSDVATTEAGLAAVFFGPIEGEVLTEAAGIIALGDTVGDRAGSAVCAAGYINDDLLADVAIGAPQADTIGNDAGAVYLVFGRSEGELSLPEADTKYIGESEGDHAGSAVVRVGDMDGDGSSELAISAPHAGDPLSDSGFVYIVTPGPLGTHPLASAEVRLNGVAENEQVGRALEPAGDLDEDGTDDLLVGAPYNDGGATGTESGRVYIVFGGAGLESGPINEAGFFINGEGDYAYVGHDIAGIGDVNEDGHRDIVVAAYNGDAAHPEAGEIYVLYGPFDADRSVVEADLTILGEDQDDHAGYALAAAGDYNGDGVGDLLIGSNGNDYGGNNAGAAYLLYAPLDDHLDLGSAEVKFSGDDDDNWAGAHLGALGDLDGDGREDIFVSAPYTDEPEDESGSLHVFYGNAGM